MLRPLHSPLHWLLWLVIALLPLRGWAWAAMLPAEVASGMAAASATAEALPPCHLVLLAVNGAAEVAAHAGHHPDSAADDSSPAPYHLGCTLCSVCHAASAPASMLILPLPAPLPHATPAGPAVLPPGWSTDVPERPPKV